MTANDVVGTLRAVFSSISSFTRMSAVASRELSLLCMLRIVCRPRHCHVNAEQWLRMLQRCSRSGRPFSTWGWSGCVGSAITGIVCILCFFLPYSSNPLHITVVVMSCVVVLWVCALTSPKGLVTAERLTTRWLLRHSKSSGQFATFIQRLVPAAVEPQTHWVLTFLFVGLLIVVQPQYSLRYTLADSNVYDNGVSVILPHLFERRKSYGMIANIFSFEKVASQMCVFQMLCGLLMRVPLLWLLLCSCAHFLALLAQIPNRGQSETTGGNFGGLVFEALFLWFLLPMSLVACAVWPFRSHVSATSRGYWYMDALRAPSSTNDAVESSKFTDLFAVSDRPAQVDDSAVASSCGAALLEPACDTHIVAVPSSSRQHHRMLSGVIPQYGAGESVAFKCPSVAIDMNGVITNVSDSFCELCGVDSAMLLHRSLESVLEWFDVDEVDAVMHVLRTVAQASAVSPGTRSQQSVAMQPSGATIDTCLGLLDTSIEGCLQSTQHRVLIRGYGTTDSKRRATGEHSGEESAAFSPREAFMSQSHSAVLPAVEGRFAVVMQVEKYRVVPEGIKTSPEHERIVLRQSMWMSALDATPLPAFLFLRESGCIVSWNAALHMVSNRSAFDMLGSNALTDVLGSESSPFVLQKDLSYPWTGTSAKLTALLAHRAETVDDANRVVSITLHEWPPQSAIRQASRTLLCVVDLNSCSSQPQQPAAIPPAPLTRAMPAASIGSRANQEGFSQQVLHSLFRILSDFNRHAGLVGNGPKQRVERLEHLADAVIGFTKNLALSQFQRVGNHQPLTVPATTGGKPKGDMEYTSTDIKLEATADTEEIASEAVPKGAWGRLVTQDKSMCLSAFVATSVGKEFTFGRSAKCTLTIPDTFVSSIQFSILRKQGVKGPHVSLIDHSANGTFVNVRKVGKGKSCFLRHNDLITFRLSNGRFFLGFIFHLLDDKLPRNPGSAAGAASTVPSGRPPLVASSATGEQQKAEGLNAAAKRKPSKIEWKIGEEVLGRGGNAEVFLGLNLTNGKLIAVKRVPLPKDSASLKQYQCLQEEINLLSAAEHPNIVHYYGSSQSETHLNILLEFVPGGSLRHLLDNFGALGDGVILSYLEQTLHGLQYLHEHNIVHSDIKAANILVTDKGQVKLTDFGTATVIHAHTIEQVTNQASFTVVGTLLWMAPELVRGESVATRASDMWSLGCAVVEMITSEFPWSEYDFENEEQIANLLRYVEEPPEVPDTQQPLISQVARLCLQLDPSKRPSCQQLLDLLHEAYPHGVRAASIGGGHHAGGTVLNLSNGSSGPLAGSADEDATQVGTPPRVSASAGMKASRLVLSSSDRWTSSSDYSHFFEEVDAAQRHVHEQ